MGQTATDNLKAIIEADLENVVGRTLPWEKLSGCRIVVTGAGGFLGAYLVRTLEALHRLGKVDQPIQIVAMVRHLDRAQQRFIDLLDSPNFELLKWDLCEIAEPLIGDAHYVIHAASQASPRYYGVDPVGTLLPNAVGTAALLSAFQKSRHPRGFLFVSSSEVYGAVLSNDALAETHFGISDPATVRACYSESKRLGETLCVAWHQQYGLPTYIVRPFHTYGPGLAAEDGRVFSDFAYNVALNQNIVMMSDGLARRAFCYVSDAIAGFFTVLLKGNPAQPYNVANPAGELSVMELAELLIGLFPGKNLVVEKRFLRDSDTYVPSTFARLVPDVTRLNDLGWTADVMPAMGFKRMVEACQT